MPLEASGQAPYTSAQAAITAIDAYRERGLGTPFTVDVLARAGVSESIANRTLQSLRLLELLNEQDQPTEQFESLREARGQEEFQSRLQEWLRSVYAEVLGYANPSEDSITDVQEAFRTYEPAGQRKAMASLLLGLWEYAGLPLAKENGQSQKPRRTRTPTRRPSAPKIRGGSAGKRSAEPGHTYGDLPPGLMGLLRELPASWTQERRNVFLKAFEAMLDFTVKVESSTEEDEVSEVSAKQEVSP